MYATSSFSNCLALKTHYIGTFTVLQNIIIHTQLILNVSVCTQDCSSFQAGSAVRAPKKSLKLDEKAIFGSSCRHEVPLLFFNIKHDGER